MIKHLIETLLVILISSSSQAQTSEIKNPIPAQFPQFTTMPVKIPMVLAGNFAELRKNHFHGGLDIKTNQKVGQPLYAVGEGYISRINVSPVGYGNAVYIDHPNGYTSVYAHCLSFSPKLEEAVRKAQYEQQDSTLDFYPEPNTIMVEEGEQVALSGNSGGSSGPHLHFEIRHTETEEPINPMFFGFHIKDTSKPSINSTYVIPVEGNVNGRNNGVIGISKGSTLTASGKISFGIKTIDKQNGAANNNGTFSIQTFVNDTLYYKYNAYRFNFDENRYIYALTDYDQYSAKRNWIYTTFRKPGNRLRMYEYMHNDGILEVEEGKTYTVKMVVSDFSGNTNTTQFYIKGKSYTEPAKKQHNVSYNWESIIEEDNYKAQFQSFTLFENQWIKHSYSNGTLTLGNSSIPVFKPFELSLQPNFTVNISDTAQYYIKAKTNAGRSESFEYPAKYIDGKFVSEVRTFGTFSIQKDNKKPIITALNIKNGSRVSSNSTAKFKVYDNETDVESFHFFIDEKWVLGVYDKKYKSVSLNFGKENISKGTHNLILKVTDECNNTNEYKATITLN